MSADSLTIHKIDNVDLTLLPSVELIAHSTRHISFSDLHGNALKFIHQLVQTGFFIGLTQDQYDLLLVIYLKSVSELTIEDLDTFEKILQVTSIDKKRSLTLIGDELSDRGRNDYFTLLILQRLHDAGVNFEIILSNHSQEFIRQLDCPWESGLLHSDGIQDRSLVTFYQLIRQFPLIFHKAVDVIDEVYRKRIKAVSYVYHQEKGQLTLYTHAPIDFSMLQELFKKFQIPLSLSSPEGLMKSIDHLNQKIHDIFQKRNLSIPLDQTDPLLLLIWNRNPLNQGRCVLPDWDVRILFVHGHTGEPEKEYSPYHHCIDNDFGKGDYQLTIDPENPLVVRFGADSGMSREELLLTRQYDFFQKLESVIDDPSATISQAYLLSLRASVMGLSESKLNEISNYFHHLSTKETASSQLNALIFKILCMKHGIINNTTVRILSEKTINDLMRCDFIATDIQAKLDSLEKEDLKDPAVFLVEERKALFTSALNCCISGKSLSPILSRLNAIQNTLSHLKQYACIVVEIITMGKCLDNINPQNTIGWQQQLREALFNDRPEFSSTLEQLNNIQARLSKIKACNDIFATIPWELMTAPGLHAACAELLGNSFLKQSRLDNILLQLTTISMELKESSTLCREICRNEMIHKNADILNDCSMRIGKMHSSLEELHAQYRHFNNLFLNLEALEECSRMLHEIEENKLPNQLILECQVLFKEALLLKKNVPQTFEELRAVLRFVRPLKCVYEHLGGNTKARVITEVLNSMQLSDFTCHHYPKKLMTALEKKTFSLSGVDANTTSATIYRRGYYFKDISAFFSDKDYLKRIIINLGIESECSFHVLTRLDYILSFESAYDPCLLQKSLACIALASEELRRLDRGFYLGAKIKINKIKKAILTMPLTELLQDHIDNLGNMLDTNPFRPSMQGEDVFTTYREALLQITVTESVGDDLRPGHRI